MIHPDCLWIPSPSFGYPRGALGQLDANIQEANQSGEFWHSIVGSLAAAKHRFLNPAEEVSAHFLLPRDGVPTQMVDSNDAAWHTGNYFANLHFHGFEFEGGASGNLSEPLTDNQIEWGIKITRWLRDVHDSPKIYVRRKTLWEHNEVQATSCPSGRIPWARFIAGLEDDMDEAEVRRIARNELIDAFAFEAGVHGATKPFVSGKHTLREWMAIFIEHKDDAAQHAAGEGYTDAQAVKAVKAKL